MTETGKRPSGVRHRWCETHPGVAPVGVCDVCGRSLCIACATPVRGRLVGVECLQGILEDIPPIHSVPPPIRRRGDVVAGGGFVAILLLSALPWSRGASSGLFGAWSPSWSVVAVAGSLGGVAVAVVALRRRWRPGLAALLYAALGLVVVVGAILHRVDPPLLSEPSAVPWFAAIGGLVTVVGALIKGQDVLRARRPGALTHRLLHRAPEMLLP